MSEKPENYACHIVISTMIFIFVVVMALITSQAFGIDALNDVMIANNITDSQSWNELNNQQIATVFTAASLQKVPPNSEKEIIVGVILGLGIGFFILFVIARYLGPIVARIMFVVSLWSLILMFFASLGYIIIGASTFTIPNLIIIFTITSTLVLLWLVYPEWWVVTTIAILLAIAGSSFFGASFPPIPVICLLIILSVYDYIAVIKTTLMMKFAKKVMSIQLPAAITLPYNRESSLITDGINFDSNIEKRSDRGFMILGTGDLLFPTVLAVSASIYASITDGIIVGGCIIGSYIVMMYTMYFSKYVSKTQGLPGLPFLCTGAIIGYIITLII